MILSCLPSPILLQLRLPVHEVIGTADKESTGLLLLLLLFLDGKTKKKRKEDKAKELLRVDSCIIDTSYIPTVLFKGR